MSPFFIALLTLVTTTFRTRSAQQAEIVALRHQIAVLQQSAPRRLRLRQSDRLLLWIWLSRFWPDWRHWLHIVKPDTVVRWHRRAFAGLLDLELAPPSGKTKPLAAAIRDLIQQMCQANFCGERRAFTVNYSSWESRSPRRRWASTWADSGIRLPRPGGPS